MIRKKISRIISIGMVLAILCAFLPQMCMMVEAAVSVSTPEIEKSKKEIQKLKDQLGDLKETQKEIQQKLDSINKETESILKQKETIDENMTAVRSEIDVTERLIENYEISIDLKRAEISDIEKVLEDQMRKFEDQMRFSYEEGFVSYLEMIFEADSFYSFLTSIDYIGSMLEYQKIVIEDIEKTQIMLKTAETELNTALLEQRDYKDQLYIKNEEYQALYEQAMETLEILKKDADKALAYQKELDAESEEFDKMIQAESSKYTALVKAEEERIRLEEERKKAEEEAEKNNADIGQGKGGFIWPVDLNKMRRITDLYGQRLDPFTGKPDGAFSWHNGVDISIPYNNDIYAAADGVVVISTYNRSLGEYVVILHENGMKTLYGHASKRLVSVGENVVQGQVIAKIGTTGASTGYHLHFGMYNKSGSLMDPMVYFPGFKEKYWQG